MDSKHFTIYSCRLSAALLIVCAGCLSTHTAIPEPVANYTAPTHDPALSAAASHSTVSPTETATVMAEVQQIGAEDPAAQQALLEDLKRTDPALWPQLVRTFRSSMAYHQQSAARLAQAPAPNSTNNSALFAAPPSYMRQVGYTDPASGIAKSSAPPLVPYPAPSNAAQTAPDSADGLLVPRCPTADLAPTYPDTMLPPVHLVAAENARPMLGADKINNERINNDRAEATSQSAAAGDWHEPLSTAIRTLESQAAVSAGQPAGAADEARLRLLYLTAGKRDEAGKPLPGAAPEEQEFWNQELSGLATLLDVDRIPDAQRRSQEAARHLQAAAGELEQHTPLVLEHLAFCTEVNSFGVYKAFPKYEFKQGQEVLLYAEVENFTSTTTDQGFHTSLHSSVQILNSRGDRMASQDFAVTEEYCRNLRRDFFVRYFLNMPKSLAKGEYTLQLTVEDTQGNKAGQANIPFSVVE